MGKQARKCIPFTKKGQSTVEYILMVAFGAVFSLQLMKFFNDVFTEGLQGLEQNIEVEMSTGQGYSGE